MVFRRVQKLLLPKALFKDLPSFLDSILNCEVKQGLFGLA
jgi:hypothetical protein